MNMNNYTIKSQEAVQAAVQLAQEKGQQAIETGHLLRGVIEKGENITNFIFNKLGVNSRSFGRFGSNRGWIPESVGRLSLFVRRGQ